MFLSCILVVGCVAVPSCELQDWKVGLTVRFDRDAQNLPTAEVTADLKWISKERGRPKTVEVGLSNDGYEGGYGRFLREFEWLPTKQSLPKGVKAEAVLLDDKHGRYEIPVSKKGQTGYRYLLFLKHPIGWGSGPDDSPHEFDGGFFWTGRALFLIPAPAQFEIRFEIPDGHYLATSFDPVPKKASTYFVPEASSLSESFLSISKFEPLQLEIAGGKLQVALGGKLQGAQAFIREHMQAYYTAAAELFDGAVSPRSMLSITLACPPGTLDGAVFGRDASICVDKSWAEDNEPRWRGVLCHESFHLWNGGLMRFQDRQMWFSEGFTEFYSHALQNRLGMLSRAEYMAVLRDKVQQYLPESHKMGLWEAGKLGAKNNTLIYHGGHLAAFCLDVILRKKSKNKRNLDHVMKAIYAEGRQGEGSRPSMDQLKKYIEKWGGADAKGFLEKHVTGDEPLPLRQVFAALGMELQTGEAAVPTVNCMSVKLLKLPSLTVVDGGILLTKKVSPPFEIDDVIREINGEAVSDFGDVCWALRNPQGGKTLPVLVRREGSEMQLQITLPEADFSDEDLQKRDWVVFEFRQEVKKAVEELRAAVLGPAEPLTESGD